MRQFRSVRIGVSTALAAATMTAIFSLPVHAAPTNRYVATAGEDGSGQEIN